MLLFAASVVHHSSGMANLETGGCGGGSGGGGGGRGEGG